MSSMKNQIQEVIKEDLNESVKSNTGRSLVIEDSKRDSTPMQESQEFDYRDTIKDLMKLKQ